MLEAVRARIRHSSELLFRASQSIRILSHVSWAPEVRLEFFKHEARELPKVSYAQFDVSEPLALIQEARRDLQTSEFEQWLVRKSEVIEKSARMLSAAGTPDFFKLSSELYGTPKSNLADQAGSAFALARLFDAQMAAFSHVDLGAPPVACHLPEFVASEIRKAVNNRFGDEAPEVLVVDELSANALAGPRRIRIRRSACFTDKDVDQLIHHEAYIHVATALNGLAQKDLKILGANHPGTTRTQEGLAVFAEFITGSMDLDRMRRLGDRVLAIQMAIEGADFLEVYRYFLKRTGAQEQAFENARRVFRGGTLSGGAPFTKDIVYLDGLLSVHNFLRAIVTSGRADCLRLLFCGKLDIEDLPVLYRLKREGLCQAAKFLPNWAKDLRFLLCHLTYSSFMNGIDFGEASAHYERILSSIPKNG